eukprot:jgi/Mesvir1/28103/Mv04687-RA.1
MTAPVEEDASDDKKKKAGDVAAGAIAGGISRFAVGPLDVVKIRLQLQLEPTARICAVTGARMAKYTGIGQAMRTIVREEGIRALWKGTIPGQLMTIPYTATQFAMLEEFRKLADSTGASQNERLAPLLPFAAGAFAGASATLVSYPLDLVRTQMAAQGEPKRYPTMIAVATNVVKRSGFQGLYSGLLPTFLEIIPYAAVQFGSYDMLKKAMAAHRLPFFAQLEPNEPLSGPERFFCGFAAGCLSKLFVHPLDVVKKRFQIVGLDRGKNFGESISPEMQKGIRHCISSILQKEGIMGLYKGLWPSLVKAAPASAVTLYVYELLKNVQ